MKKRKKEIKKMVGKKIEYLDYDNKIIEGTIKHIGFNNKDFSIVWFYVDFYYKAFLVDINSIVLKKNIQLDLFYDL
jgi:hypothetical protein